MLVPFRDSAAIARALINLLTDPVKRDNMRKQAYLLGRQMVWSQLTHAFLESFRKAREVPLRQARSRLALDTQEQQPRELPLLRLDHLRTLTDNTGILQHAVFSVPNRKEGYCTDDNARALLLTVLLEQTGDDTPEVRLLASRYAAFLNDAFIPATGRFHNFIASIANGWTTPGPKTAWGGPSGPWVPVSAAPSARISNNGPSGSSKPHCRPSATPGPTSGPRRSRLSASMNTSGVSAATASSIRSGRNSPNDS